MLFFSGGKKLVALLALGIFLWPITQALQSEKDWRAQLESGLKGGSAPELFELTGLFKSEEPLPYQTREYATDLTLDFYAAQAEGVRPLVVVIHGGGWDSGNSQQLPELNTFLARRGYHVASINYRLAPVYQWPAQLEDLRKAMAFLKSQAQEWRLDMDKIAMLGRSAGAQIAGVYAYSKEDPGVKGFIDFYGPSDLKFGYEVAPDVDIIHSRQLIRQLHGGTPYEKAALYETSSILKKIDERPVPTLLLHGFPDILTWYKHSERLHEELKLRGIKSAFILLPWGAHGFDYTLRGPGGQVSSNAVLYFLKSIF